MILKRHTRNLSTCKLTEAQRQQLQALAAMPDDTIDFSDFPELSEKFWQNAIPNPFYRPAK